MLIPESLYDVETKNSNRLQTKEKSVEGQESSVSKGVGVQAVVFGVLAVTSATVLFYM